MPEAADLLLAYDRQLRTEAETPSAIAQTRLGPLRLVTFAGGRGFVTYAAPQGDDAAAMVELVGPTVDHYRQIPEVTRVEWKTRGHDRVLGLHEALILNGLEPDEPEAIMVGQASSLDVVVPLPTGVTMRKVTDERD